MFASSTRVRWSLAIVGALWFAPAQAQSAGLDKETAADVMRAGANGVAGFDAALIEINEARAIAAQMSRDAGFAQKVLDLARRGDKAGLAALMRPYAPRSGFVVTRVVDFTVDIKAARFIFCWSNSNGCPGGSNFLLMAVA
jgi:hypothetical protein